MCFYEMYQYVWVLQVMVVAPFKFLCIFIQSIYLSLERYFKSIRMYLLYSKGVKAMYGLSQQQRSTRKIGSNLHFFMQAISTIKFYNDVV